MKQVGLMTWFKYRNFGTALQVSALAHKVRELGYQPVLMNYTPRKIRNIPDNSLRGIGGKAKAILVAHFKRLKNYDSTERRHMFETFIKRNVSISNLLENAVELSDAAEALGAVICGSDQIWSPVGFDDKYFLSFVRETKKMVAYAPSLGLPVISDSSVAREMRRLVMRFRHLSVREKQGADLLENLCGMHPEVVLDPTLLLRANDWNELTSDSSVPKKFYDRPYAIAYWLGDPARYRRAVERFERTARIPVYVVPVFEIQIGTSRTVPFETGPAEFVQLIAHARYVLTDSFHGTAFAINYRKPFTVFKRFTDGEMLDQNSRIYNILTLTGLSDRLADEKNFFPTNALLNCSFDAADDRLDIEREKSWDFLRKSLAEAVSTGKSVLTSVSQLSFCCGCGACSAICPVNAISISYNDDGFYEKSVDETKCIHCRKCLSVCPVHDVDAGELKDAISLSAYQSPAIKLKRTRSSSGAIGADLAGYLANHGYLVAGCIYDKQIDRARHVLVQPDDKEGLESIKGSKYIPSESSEVFRQIMQRKNNKIVFFGTPCQVAALRKLSSQMSTGGGHLILVDLICHGVPSYLLWDKYLELRNKDTGVGTHPEVEFRSAQAGWRARSLSVEGNGQAYLKWERKDEFYAFFRPALCYMHSCYECPYRERSAADLRIGDYWGDRYRKDKMGVSMVIANTQRGADILGNLPGQMERHELSEYWSVQWPYNQQEPVFYHDLMNDLRNPAKGLAELYRQYAKPFSRREEISILYTHLKSIYNQLRK